MSGSLRRMLRRLRFICSRLKEAKARPQMDRYPPRRRERRDASRCSDEVLQRLGAGLLCGSGSLRLRLQIVSRQPGSPRSLPQEKAPRSVRRGRAAQAAVHQRHGAGERGAVTGGGSLDPRGGGLKRLRC